MDVISFSVLKGTNRLLIALQACNSNSRHVEVTAQIMRLLSYAGAVIEAADGRFQQAALLMADWNLVEDFKEFRHCIGALLMAD